MTPHEAIEDPALVRDPVEELAELFLERLRRGERPPLSEFIARAPEHADEIRELFPALLLLEQADPAAGVLKTPAAPSSLHLQRLGDYKLVREVGRGGMGIVYEAEQESLGRQVALKILPTSLAADPRCLIRFRREARSAARLHHTNIVPVFDIGERDGIHYYAMQLIHGQGLDAVIAELRRLRSPNGNAPPMPPLPSAPGSSLTTSLAGHLWSGQSGVENRAQLPADARGAAPTLPPLSSSDRNPVSSWTERSDFTTKSDFQFYRSVARLGLQVAGALAYAHGQRVLHRDIKPANLLLDSSGIVWVTDFGLAKEEGDDLTRTGDVVGTLRYMAPERLSGVSEPRSDIYGLGVTLYELLTLQPAFQETDRAQLMQTIARREPAPLRKVDANVPRDLETIVLKAIAKEPGRRYAKAADMEEDLQRFLMDRPIRARRTSRWERGWRWCRRNPGWAATLATVFGLLLFIAVGGGIFNMHLQQALDDVRQADHEKTEKLWQSYVDRARALFSSGRVGQRFEALKAIREAAQIKVSPELRDAAVAALALPDVEVVREWDGFPEGTLTVAFDASLQRYARLDREGQVTVCRLSAEGEEVLFRLPAHGRAPFGVLWMSPDGRFLAYGHSAFAEAQPAGVRIWRIDRPQPECWDDVKGMNRLALAFDKDSRRLAIGYANGSVKIYNVETKSTLQTFHLGIAAQVLAFSPLDGRLAAACGESVRLFDVDTGKQLPPLRHPSINSWSFGLAWHPEGRILAAASDDKKIHVWDTQTATEVLSPMTGHAASGIFMAFNHAGDRLISTGWDSQTRLWDATNGRHLLTMPGQFGNAFSPDDSTIGVQQVGRKLRLWRLADGRELRVIRRPRANKTDPPHNGFLDADGRIVASGCRTGLCFFDLQTGRELASMRVGEVASYRPIAFDRQVGLLTCSDQGLLLWPRHEDPMTPGTLHIGPPRRLASTIHNGADATSDGRVKAIPLGHQTLVVDDLQPGKRIYLGPQYDVRYAAVSADGKWVASCSWWSDGRSKGVKIWEAATGRQVAELPVDGSARAYFDPSGRWLATTSSDRGCQLWEVGTWQPGKCFGQAGFIWTRGGRMLVVTDPFGGIRFLDPETGKEHVRLTSPDPQWYSPAFMTPDGAMLVLVGADYSGLYVWDLRRIRAQLRELNMDWDLPEQPAPPEQRLPPAVTVDPGYLRQPPLGNDRHVAAVFSLALALQPLNPEACFQRGLAFERLKDRDKAIADYEMFLATAPATDPRRQEICLRQATLYDSLQKKRQAVASLARMINGPDDLVPWPGQYASLCNNLAWHFVNARHARLPDAILSISEKAKTLEPCNFLYQNTYGVALYRLGRYEEAVRCLEDNVPRSEQMAAFDLYFLAMSHQRLGHLAEARACFDRAVLPVQPSRPLTQTEIAELAAFRAEAEEVLEIRK